MDYLDGRLTSPQKSGFAIICQDEEGNFLYKIFPSFWINNKTIIIYKHKKLF